MYGSQNVFAQKVHGGFALEHTGYFELVRRGIGGVDDVIAELMKRPTLQHVHLHDVNAALLSERGVDVGFLTQALIDLVTKIRTIERTPKIGS